MRQCEEQLKKHQRHRQMCYSLVILYDYESYKSHSKHLELSFIQNSVAQNNNNNVLV